MNNNNLRVPKKFKLFSATINVVFDNRRMEDKKLFGEFDSAMNKITLCDMYGGEEVVVERVSDTFYHEKVHAILDAMNEKDLNNNEKFVDLFAKLLRQSDETAEFEEQYSPRPHQSG
jgi:hypothetical protein